MCVMHYGCDNDIIFNSSKSQVMFFDTMTYGHMKNIMLGQKTLNVTKSYMGTYLGHIITDNLCDEADIKAKVGCLYGRSNILLRKFYFRSERVKNMLFSSYCSNLYLCSLWANYRKSSMSRFIDSYNNAFRILHNLHMYGVPFSHLFTELQISAIEVHISPIQLQISPIQLQISPIQLQISPNRVNCRYLQFNWRYLQFNWRYLQIGPIWRYLQFNCRYLQFDCTE